MVYPHGLCLPQRSVQDTHAWLAHSIALSVQRLLFGLHSVGASCFSSLNLLVSPLLSKMIPGLFKCHHHIWKVPPADAHSLVGFTSCVLTFSEQPRPVLSVVQHLQVMVSSCQPWDGEWNCNHSLLAANTIYWKCP